MTPGVFIGCCGWTLAQARYIERFPVIELQTPFYEPPALAVARRWRAMVPPEFGFCLKAWQLITHTPDSPTYRRLKSGVSREERDLYGSFRPTEQVALAWERTRELALVLNARVVVFQCPKSFLPTRENLSNFNRFFADIDRAGLTLAWEPRGDDWGSQLIRELCQTHRLIHCTDPFARESVTPGAIYWRLHGRSGYRYRYTGEDLRELDAMLRSHPVNEGSRYVLFNNIYSKEDAGQFLELRSQEAGASPEL